MIREFKWVPEREIKTFKDIKDSTDGFFIKDEVSCCTHDQDIILGKNKETSLKRLLDIQKQGAKVYRRVKEFRKPIFNKEVDYEIDGLLGELIYDLAEEFSQEQASEEFLRKLKKILEKELRII